MSGSRNNAVVNEDIILTAQYIQNNVNFEPYTWDKVEIYATKDDADAGTNILSTIATGDISSNGDGLGTYTALATNFTAASTYYDKVFVTPTNGASQQFYIMPIFVHKESYGMVAPGSIEKVNIALNMFGISDDAKEGDPVYVTLGNNYAVYGNLLIKRDVKTFRVNSEGLVVDPDDDTIMSLAETTTMTADTGEDVFYELTTMDGEFTRLFTVPKGTVDSEFFDLPVYTIPET